MSETRTGALVHGLPLEADRTSCCGLEPELLSEGDEVVEPSGDLALVSCAGLCRRCGQRPGRERYYKPGNPGEVSYSLAGVTPKVSVKQTVGCDTCWLEFVALREETGYPQPNGGSESPVRACCGQRHAEPECPDGLVPCALCFTRVTREDLHVLPDGSREDVCVPCAEREATAVEAVRADLVPVGYREFGDPWPPPGGRAWRGKLVVKRGWGRVTALVRGWLEWRARGQWLAWLVIWLAGLALVVVGGGIDGVVAAAGLVATGAGAGLFIRWLWEVLS